MSNLTDEQLQDLVCLVNNRLREFGPDMFPPLSWGVVRLMVEALRDWEQEQDAEIVEDYANARKQAYDNGYQAGSKAAQEEIFEQRLIEFKRGWDCAMERLRDGPDDDEGDDFDDGRGGHRRFVSTSPAGRQFWINGDPNMAPETERAIGEMADAAFEHLATRNLSSAGEAVEEMKRAIATNKAQRDELLAELNTANGHGPTNDDPATLADAWPPMPDIDGGVDRFAQHPVAGVEPEAEAKQDADDDLVDTIPTPLDGLQIEPPKTDEELTSNAEPATQPHAAAAYDLLRDLAVDDIMPRQTEYDAAKGDDMPSAARLKQILGLTWGQLADNLGFKMLTPIERANRLRIEQADSTPQPQAPVATAIAQPRTLAEVDAEAEAKIKRVPMAEAHRQRRIELTEKAFALLRSLAVDEQMPPISLYNERCAEADLPDARLLLNNLGCMDWGELAQMAGLKWFGRGGRGK